MKFGIQLGKVFVGVDTTSKGGMTVSAPFTENVENGQPYRITSTDFGEILSALRGGYTDTNLIELFGSIAEIFSPIDTIITRACNGRFYFENIATGEEIKDDEELNKILTQPNPFQNLQEVFYEAMAYQYVTGKEYMYFNTPSVFPKGDYKNVSSIWNLPANKITLKLPDRIKLFSATKISDVIKGYILEAGTEAEQEFNTDDVLYKKDVNLDWKKKKVEGRSRLLSAEKAIANLIAVYEARGVIYLKRGAMGMWVSRKSDDSGMISLTDTEKKAARKDLDQSYGLQKKKDLVGITSSPIDFVTTSMTIREMEPFVETKADASAIYAVVGVPDELMPGNDAGTYENKKIAEISVYRNTSIPLAETYCTSINNFLKVRASGIRLCVSFEHIEVLQYDKDKMAKWDALNNGTFLSRFSNGVMTLNDWRVAAELPKVTTVALYDKLIYEMSPEELKKVTEILSIQKTPTSNVGNTSTPTN